MISSVSYLTNPYKNNPSRSTDKSPRPGSAVAGATEAIDRAIDQIDSGAEKMQTESFSRSDEQPVIDSQRGQARGAERDPVQGAVEMMTGQATASANIAVMKSMDRMVGTLLDVFA